MVRREDGNRWPEDVTRKQKTSPVWFRNRKGYKGMRQGVIIRTSSALMTSSGWMVCSSHFTMLSSFSDLWEVGQNWEARTLLLIWLAASIVGEFFQKLRGALISSVHFAFWLVDQSKWRDTIGHEENILFISHPKNVYWHTARCPISAIHHHRGSLSSLTHLSPHFLAYLTLATKQMGGRNREFRHR